MKQTIEHLPEIKRAELKHIVSVIREMCDDVEMIILFGSYARGDYKVEADLKPDRRSGHVSDYDILVVPELKTTAEDSLLWRKITEACNALKFSAHPRIIVHDIWDLNIKLVKGQYFFPDIKKEGCMLFDSHDFKLEDARKLAPEEQQKIAREHFKYWFKSATDFYTLYLSALEKEIYTKAAFLLHQTTEHCYKAFLLVSTNYIPNEHWLAVLGDLITEENGSFTCVFPRKTKEEEHRFNLLDYAYISARYVPSFNVSKKDLEILAVHVENLLELTEKICKQKIESFTNKKRQGGTVKNFREK
ncbi:MAG: HEPN domain-containing protein [Victivallaceae bacterium]|nr:HEPN domain-containing protein [Victivallaceae bacterium]